MRSLLKLPLLLIALCSPGPCLVAQESGGYSAQVKMGPRGDDPLEGQVTISGGKLSVSEEAGEQVEIDWRSLRQITFDNWRIPEPDHELRKRQLPPQWKHGPVGELPRGGGVKVRDGNIILTSSAPDREYPFGAFYTAYRPLPEGGGYITARVVDLEKREKTRLAGVILRDGEGVDARSVVLSHIPYSLTTMAMWERAEQWLGYLAADIPVFCSQVVTAKTPGHAVKFDVDISGSKRLFLIAHGGLDGVSSDWANWCEPIIVVDGKEKKLTELPWVEAKTDYGKVQIDRNGLGGEMRVANKVVPFGIGTHANSMIEFELPPNTTRFKGWAGIDQGGGVEQSSLRFMVFTQKPKERLERLKPVGPGLKIQRDVRRDAHVGHWLRLVRDRGKITGYVSEDGDQWREIWAVKDTLGPDATAGLIALGRYSENRWESVFENVRVGPVSELPPMPELEPRITLVDGTVFHEKIESATDTLVRLGGESVGRVVPLLHVSNIQFYVDTDSNVSKLLNSGREGLWLSSGDFYEGKITSLDGKEITAQSNLFGSRKFDTDVEVHAWILNRKESDPSTPKGFPFKVETWRGDRIYVREMQVDGNGLQMETRRWGRQKFSLGEIYRITKIGKFPDEEDD